MAKRDSQLDTVRCSSETQTIPSGAAVVELEPESLTIPKDSEWAGFSAEMAEYLAEVLAEAV